MTKVWIGLGAVVLAALVVVAFVVSGGTGDGGSSGPGGGLATWVSSNGLGQEIGTLEGDAVSVREVLAHHTGTGALHTVCAAMANDAQTYNDQLPSPDTQVTQWLAHAYGFEYDAAETCYGADSADARLLARAATDRRRAETLFVKVLRRVRAVTGKSVSTTTTTGPTVTATGFG